MDQLPQLSEKDSWNAILTIGHGSLRAPRLVFCLVLCSVIFIAACEKAPVKPAEFTQSDVCFACKAPITNVELPFAAEFVTENGFVRKFDDLSCLIANAKKVGKKNIVAVYAVDLQSQKLFPIEQVQLLRSENFKTPKKGGIIAIKDQAQADQFATKFKAEKVKLDDLLK
jgi:hypothetical protein